MRYLLDTNILIYVLNARPQRQAVPDRFNRERPDNMVVSSITLAELRFGLENSSRRDTTQDRLNKVLAALNVVAFDEREAETYGWIRAAMESAGKPIGPLDTLIAAHAVSLNVTLITANVREFSRASDLRVENWIPN
jgi:tRNA(fMet)-specific endonuclease VapC